MKKLLTFIVTLFLVACGAVADAPVGQPQPDTQVSGDTTQLDTGAHLVWVTPSDAISLDPHRVGDHPSWNAQAQIFEGLTWFDESDDLQPRLAYSFEQIEPTVWQFILREGVYFTDGAPFNAYAVALSFERLLDPITGSPVATTLFDMISEVVAVDNYIVHIYTYFAFSPLPSHLTHMGAYIVSPLTIHEERSGGTLVNDNPVGTGPFMLSQWVHGDRKYFVPNPTHWAGQVHIDSLTFQVIPETATRHAMIEIGEAHGHAGTAMNIPVYRELAQNPGIEYFIVIPPSIDYIGFNLNNEFLANQYVRRAINAAIDRDAILAIFEGNALLAASAASPQVDFAPQGMTVPVRNLDYARELLSQTPWPEGGFTLRYWYNVGNPGRSLIGQLLQANLADIGIQVVIEAIEWGAFLAAASAGEHDMFILGWSTVTMDADRAFFGMHHSSNHGAYGNRFWYSNPVADELLEAGRTETDPVQRQAIYNEIGALLAYDLPMIPLVFSYSPFITNGISGFHADQRSVPFFHNVTLH